LHKSICLDKMENKKYHTVGIVHKSLEKQKIPYCRNGS